MRVLLDENLDHRLRKSLGTHEVFTASYKGWDGLKNAGRRLAIVSLSSIEWRVIKNYLPQIVGAVDNALPGSFQAVDFSRKKSPGQ